MTFSDAKLFIGCILGGLSCGVSFAMTMAFINRPVQTPVASMKIPVGISAADIIGQSTAPSMQNAQEGQVSKLPTIVEFADYQCPPCAQTNLALHDWLPTVQGKVRLVYRNFPLKMHKNAFHAAVAAEAAREQGKFDEMHDLLFQHQDALDDAHLVKYAKQIGLDMKKFRVAQATTAKRYVEADAAFAEKLDIPATPTLLLCGTDGNIQVTSLSELKEKF